MDVGGMGGRGGVGGRGAREVEKRGEFAVVVIIAKPYLSWRLVWLMVVLMAKMLVMMMVGFARVVMMMVGFARVVMAAFARTQPNLQTERLMGRAGITSQLVVVVRGVGRKAWFRAWERWGE